MIAQRTHVDMPAAITAIDIDTGAVAAATLNFAASPWTERLHAQHADLATWTAQQPTATFHSIVCNPPYFNNGEQAHCQARATARHTDSLSHATLLASLSHLLSEHGTASLILPVYEGQQLMAAAADHQLYCTQVCEVRSTATKPASRLLIALSRSPQPSEHSTLTIHEAGRYSAPFTALTQDFYLKM